MAGSRQRIYAEEFGRKLLARVAASWRLRLQREVTNHSTVCCGAQTTYGCRIADSTWKEIGLEEEIQEPPINTRACSPDIAGEAVAGCFGGLYAACKHRDAVNSIFGDGCVLVLFFQLSFPPEMIHLDL